MLDRAAYKLEGEFLSVYDKALMNKYEYMIEMLNSSTTAQHSHTSVEMQTETICGPGSFASS